MTSTARTASAAVFTEVNQPLQFTDIAVREPRGDEVLIRVKAAGVCHSDLHLTNGDWPVENRVVPGHEAAGIIEAIGPDTRHLQVGDHVVLSWFPGCRDCANCLSGRGWACPNTKAIDNELPDGSSAFTHSDGDTVWPFLGLGAFSEFIVVPENAAVAVPAELPFPIGALIGCSVTTGVGAVTNTAKVQAGSSAVVIGCGGIGQSIILGLALVGADPIIAVDLSEERRDQALYLGATHTLDGADPDLAERISSLTAGGAEYAFEAIGRVQTVELGPRLLRAGGVFVIVGMTPIGQSASIDPFDLADQGKTIIGCNYGSSTPGVDFPKLAKLYLAQRLPLDKLIGSTAPLTEADNALSNLQSVSGLRTVLIP